MPKTQKPSYDLPDDLSIPSFLRVENRSKEPPTFILKGAQVEDKPDPLAPLSAATRARVEGLIKSGKFRLHWMEDPSIVAHLEEQTARLSQRREEAIERLKSLPKKERPVKPKFGAGIKIKVLKQTTRKPGSKAAKIYDAMVAWVKKNPGRDATALFEDTPYTKGFYLADMKAGNIKTDV